MDDDGIIDFELKERKRPSEVITSGDRQLSSKLDASPPDLQRNDSRASMLSKTSITSSTLARNGFISLKKMLHPVIFTRENKKRKLNAL